MKPDVTASGFFMGTCSWNYEHWPIYSSRKKKPAEYLPEYSRYFNSVEIDSWFYKIPDETTVVDYYNSVPADFVFSVKVPSSLTRPVVDGKTNPHFLETGLFDTFLETAALLNEKLGILIFQFEYLNKQKIPDADYLISKLDAFSGKCDRRFKIGIEIRNPNYLNDRYFSFLQSAGMFPVFTQKLYMPDIGELMRKFAGFEFETVVIRLLGDDRKEIEVASGERWDSIIFPKPEKKDIVEQVRKLLGKGVEVFLNINNHYEGSSVITADFFRQNLFIF